MDEPHTEPVPSEVDSHELNRQVMTRAGFNGLEAGVISGQRGVSDMAIPRPSLFRTCLVQIESRKVKWKSNKIGIKTTGEMVDGRWKPYVF